MPRLVSFAIGLVAGAVAFFSCCMSVSEYVEMFRSVVGGAAGGGASSHGFKSIALWIEKSGVHVCFRIVLPAAALFLSFLVRRSGISSGLAIPVAVASAVLGGLFVTAMPAYDFINGFEPRFPSDFPWIAAVFLALASARERTGDWAFLLAILAIPVVLSFGTVVPIASRARIYVWPLAFAALLKAETSIRPERAAKVRAVFLLMVFFSAVFCFRQHSGSWILLERDFFATKVVDRPTGLRLSPQFAENVAKCREAGLGGGAVVQPLSRNDWRYVFSLGATPVSYRFECESFDPEASISGMKDETAYFIVPSGAPTTRFSALSGVLPSCEIVPILSFRDIDGARVVYKAVKK